jgi:hypothetical protein
MAKKLGHEYKVYVDNGSGTFNPIAGEVSHNREGSTTLIDQSAKGTGQIAIQAPGRKTLVITVEGKKDLPDSGGLERVYALQKVYPQVAGNFQIRKDPFAGGDVIFASSMFISNFNDGAPDQDNATFSFQLTCAAAPTTDNLN